MATVSTDLLTSATINDVSITSSSLADEDQARHAVRVVSVALRIIEGSLDIFFLRIIIWLVSMIPPVRTRLQFRHSQVPLKT